MANNNLSVQDIIDYNIKSPKFDHELCIPYIYEEYFIQGRPAKDIAVELNINANDFARISGAIYNDIKKKSKIMNVIAANNTINKSKVNDLEISLVKGPQSYKDFLITCGENHLTVGNCVDVVEGVAGTKRILIMSQLNNDAYVNFVSSGLDTFFDTE